MATMEMTQALDGMDDETAKVVIQVHLMDVQEHILQAAGQSFEVNDLELAFQAMEVELKRYRHDRGLADDGDPTRIAQDTSQREYEATLIQCHSCLENTPIARTHSAPCEHQYCDECLTALFRDVMVDITLYPTRCCRQIIAYDNVKSLIAHEVQTAFEAKREELDDPSKLYCRVPTCSAYIGSAHRTADRATCPACHTLRCLLCANAPHPGDCPTDQAAQELLDAANQAGWRRCPSCSEMIELTFGCNHMTCRCQAQFCYLCGERWKTCTCPQWNEARLLDRAAEVARRVNADADDDAIQREANHLRQRHNCTHAFWNRINEPELRCEECRQTLRTHIFRCRQCRLQACYRCRHHRL